MGDLVKTLETILAQVNVGESNDFKRKNDIMCMSVESDGYYHFYFSGRVMEDDSLKK